MEQNEGAAPAQKPGSKRNIFLILAGLVAIGVAAGYKWLRSLPR